MKKRRSVLINCSNLHDGGAVAVAASFICCLSHKENIDADISVLASSRVHSNLVDLRVNFDSFKEFSVADYYGVKALWQGLDRHFIGHDAVFTVFGPAYFLQKKTLHIVGFAQPWIIYPNNAVGQSMNYLARLKQKLKFIAQEYCFSRADEIIVELDHVRVGLKNKRLFKKIPVHIVNSSVDKVFMEPARWHPISPPTAHNKNNKLKLGIISRNYPHKNLACLPKLKERLRELLSIESEFFVTFRDDEWALCSEHFKQEINNVGPLTLPQCPSFYNSMDGIIFPSLLECFSAVPIEAMMMRKPLFASNLPFIVDCCHEHANYFNPHDVDSMAMSISAYFGSNKSQQDEFLRLAYTFVQSYPNAESRTDAYIRIVLDSINARSEC